MRTGRCKRHSPVQARFWARRTFGVKAWLRRSRGLLARAGVGRLAWRSRTGISAMLFRRGFDARIGGEGLPDQAESAVHLRAVAVAGKAPGDFQQRQFPGGTAMVEPGQSFEKLQGTIGMHWFPRESGDDYEMQWRAHAGKTFGQIPFDELFMLGVDRDNDLPLRAHHWHAPWGKGKRAAGTELFSFQLGKRKHVYSNGILTVKLGPFLDTGRYDSSSASSQTLGPHKWLFDIGPQAKLKVLGVGVVLLYGKDLRTGNNAFYTSVGWR